VARFEGDKMGNQDVVDAYTAAAKRYGELFFTELLGKPLDRKLYDLFLERLPSGGTCLEIGCGPGEVATYIKSKGIDVIGADKSPGMIEAAKRLNPEIEYRVEDAFRLGMGDGQFDGVVAPFLIVNFSDAEIRKALAEMFRVLKKDGALLLAFHAGKNKVLRIRNFLDSGKALSFILHDVKKLKAMMADCGFAVTEVVEKEPYEGEVTRRAFVYGKKKSRADA
jgi:ubiquinone/menaquinone biosynthesis C-methylase UbiE